tara:strand:- start:151 stop:303 length:153 start_codon:yes stop_codon:yes gene_type:complete
MKITSSLIWLEKTFKDLVKIYPVNKYSTIYKNPFASSTSSVHRRRDLDSL